MTAGAFPLSLELSLAASTERLGEAVGQSLSGGEVIALNGPLGAGKTTFVRGLARGLGMDPDYAVASPTFVLLQRYPCIGLELWHLDLYRVSSLEDAESTGYRDALGRPEAVMVVEWADRVPHLLPEERLEITLSYQGEGRMAALAGRGDRYRALAAEAAQRWRENG